MNRDKLIDMIVEELLLELDRAGVNYEADPDFLKHADRQAELDGGTIKFAGCRGPNMFFNINSFEFDDPTKDGYKVVYTLIIQFKRFMEIISDHIEVDDNGKRYIRPLDFKEAQRAASQLVKDDIRVFCNCPSFKYHYQYVATEKDDSSVFIEVIPANIRNPHKRGLPCKHTRRINNVFPAYYSELVSYLRGRGKIYNDEYKIYVKTRHHM